MYNLSPFLHICMRRSVRELYLCKMCAKKMYILALIFIHRKRDQKEIFRTRRFYQVTRPENGVRPQQDEEPRPLGCMTELPAPPVTTTAKQTDSARHSRIPGITESMRTGKIRQNQAESCRI